MNDMELRADLINQLNRYANKLAQTIHSALQPFSSQPAFTKVFNPVKKMVLALPAAERVAGDNGATIIVERSFRYTRVVYRVFIQHGDDLRTQIIMHTDIIGGEVVKMFGSAKEDGPTTARSLKINTPVKLKTNYKANILAKLIYNRNKQKAQENGLPLGWNP